MKAASQLLRQALSTKPALGGGVGTFSLPCRKVVLEYCESSVASKGMRDFLQQHIVELAHANPSVEFVVMPRPQRAPLLRAFYLNGRSKQLSTHNLPATQIMPKMQLILESSGAKTAHLKRMPVQSTSPSARGIWSPLHDDSRQL